MTGFLEYAWVTYAAVIVTMLGVMLYNSIVQPYEGKQKPLWMSLIVQIGVIVIALLNLITLAFRGY